MSRSWGRGSVVWAVLDPASGREQARRRPVVVVAAEDYLDAVTTLVVVPVTTVDRGWPNHVLLRGGTGRRRHGRRDRCLARGLLRPGMRWGRSSPR